MRVLLNTQINGLPSGTIAEVDDDEVAGYIAAGMVAFVDDDHPDTKVESAAVEPSENAVAPKPKRRKTAAT